MTAFGAPSSRALAADLIWRLVGSPAAGSAGRSDVGKNAAGVLAEKKEGPD
jgi:hypothetical protein